MSSVAKTLLAVACIASPALANGFEDLDRLDLRVSEFAELSGGKAQPIDRRIKLVSCPEAPVLESGVMGMVVVRCTSKGWRLRVPLLPTGAGSTYSVQAEVNETPLVRKGEAVKVAVVGDAFSVSYEAIAMDNGALGKQVRVKFPTQTSFFTATVIAQGKVQMND